MSQLTAFNYSSYNNNKNIIFFLTNKRKNEINKIIRELCTRVDNSLTALYSNS